MSGYQLFNPMTSRSVTYFVGVPEKGVELEVMKNELS